jgi:hypothetical protein
MLRLLYSSAIRVSELARLKWCDLLPRSDGGQVTVFGKGGKTRAILLKPKTWNLLLSFRGDAVPADPVFRSRKGGHLDVSQIRRVVYAAAHRAGLSKKVSPHWLRQRPRQSCARPQRTHPSGTDHARPCNPFRPPAGISMPGPTNHPRCICPNEENYYTCAATMHHSIEVFSLYLAASHFRS